MFDIFQPPFHKRRARRAGTTTDRSPRLPEDETTGTPVSSPVSDTENSGTKQTPHGHQQEREKNQPTTNATEKTGEQTQTRETRETP